MAEVERAQEPGAPSRLLVVDDENRGGEMMARSLRRFGQVDLAASGEAALELVQQTQYDVVISDQMMPGMNGVELLTRVADLDDSTGRILITAYTDLDSAVEAINRGRVHAYLPKPCLPDKLRDAVSGVLGRTRRIRERDGLLDRLRKQNLKLASAVASARTASEAIRSGDDES